MTDTRPLALDDDIRDAINTRFDSGNFITRRLRRRRTDTRPAPTTSQGSRPLANRPSRAEMLTGTTSRARRRGQAVEGADGAD